MSKYGYLEVFKFTVRYERKVIFDIQFRQKHSIYPGKVDVED